MALKDTATQLPAADDIDQDSLDYLFGPRLTATPWVRMAREPEPVARISPEIVRVQAKLEALAAQLEVVSTKLQSAHHDLGYARAQLAEKDEQLKQMAEYRLRAAQAIMGDIEREQLRDRVLVLEAQLVELLQGESTDSPSDNHGISSPPTDGIGHNYDLERALDRHRTFVGTGFPLMLATYLLMICFAIVVLLTVLV